MRALELKEIVSCGATMFISVMSEIGCGSRVAGGNRTGISCKLKLSAQVPAVGAEAQWDEPFW